LRMPVAGGLAYLAAFVLAELIGAFVVQLGVVLHCVLVAALVLHFLLSRGSRLRPLLPALAAASLLRLLSLGVPWANVALPVRVALVGAPLLLATILVLRLQRFPAARLGAGSKGWWWQGLIALAGLPLSVLAFLVVQPERLAPGGGPWALLAFAVFLTIFGGCTEELLFRGALQEAAAGIFGRTAPWVSSVAFAAAYLGARSAQVVGVVGAIGLFFGLCADRTRSVAGVALAHSLVNVGVFLVWPSVLP
jgi:membrane protease YdiL (CAAX protease family)